MSILFLALFGVGIKAGASWVLPSGGSAPSMNIFPPVNVGDVLQFKNGSFVAQGLKSTVSAIFEGSLQITAGTGIPGLGKVLTSDATGMASWQTPTGGGNGTGNVDNNNIDGTTNYVTKWTGPHTIGNSQIFDNATGVGIATTSPASGVKLDVNGKVKMTGFQLGSTATSGYVLTADAQGNGTWLAGGANSGGGWTRDPETLTVRLTNPTDKVGIGTASPTEQLEITKNFYFPDTNSTGTAGVMFFGPNRFMHKAGEWNTFVGENAGNFGIGGNGNTGAGAESLKNNTSGDSNSALGYKALISNTSGNNNTAVGKSALQGNTSGNNNTAVGMNALSGNNGDNNSALGLGALSSNSSGSGNTALGKDAMSSNTSGSNNIAIGYQANVGSGSLTNATVIGPQAIVNASNTMVFGNSSVVGWGFGTQPGGDAIKVSNGARLTAGGAWTDASDRNKKYDIVDTHYGLNDILKLRPVDYKLKINDEQSVGFIAQEVKEVIPELVYGEEGDMTMSYGQMTAVLTKAVQDLKNENDELRARLEALKLKVKNN